MKSFVRRQFEQHPSLKWRYQLLASKGMAGLISRSPSFITRKTKFCNKFLFIVGSGRCGSTLLRRLLVEKCNIYIPPETYVLPSTYLAILRKSEYQWPDVVHHFVDSFENHPEFPTFGLASLESFRRKAIDWRGPEQHICRLVEELYWHFGKSVGIDSLWVGDKTPSYIFHLGIIQHMISGARYIYLLRDGVDVAVSCKNAGRYDNFQDGAYRWVRSQQCWAAFKKTLAAEQYFEVRYEDMVANEQATLSRIMEKYDIPARQDTIDVFTRLGDVNLRPHHGNALLPVTSSFVSKGREILSKDERRRLGVILNSELENAGYERIS